MTKNILITGGAGFIDVNSTIHFKGQGWNDNVCDGKEVERVINKHLLVFVYDLQRAKGKIGWQSKITVEQYALKLSHGIKNSANLFS